MSVNCFGNSIEIYEYSINNISYTDCLIRKRRVVLYPEERVRQALILYLVNFTNINADNYVIKVEYKNLDIAIYQKHKIKYFQPACPPILIIEVKNQFVDVLNFESQLLKYLSLNSCNNGILTNCRQLYIYSKNNNFIKTNLTLCELDKVLIQDNFDKDIDLFEDARNGNIDSFLKLIEKYGKSNTITFQCSIYKMPIDTFFVSHSMDYIFFDLCGVKSKKNQPKIRKNDFIKLISICGH
ncbi:type I restriction enzyme HsdR N-terminal domain-containing protein [Phormidium tenue]|uniref:Type I restriction enzyme HsdR N-terminal domain-containing protein n=1 Tax=Phormidium tenue FACHB-1050 TaxID=2692857 RepID=A0ABR8CD76_9CYAN|nr:type I restriction enzyme HsdR N-terminal domain-containing protein [Phormidium tenue]MBD2318669.1 type I restriction enzyme HsdR N-terminal domain-containing protein [Phormidium tenue FACHB-1050]